MLLCIDDDIIILEVLKAVLERYGYSVIATSGGPQGLTILAEYAIDLVILDWEMPEMNGHETASEIRRMKPEMPIIISSGSQMPEDTFKIADAFVPKGIEFEVLLTAISDLLGRAATEGLLAPEKTKAAHQERFS
jgi:CheY-like chemotaxis protein